MRYFRGHRDTTTGGLYRNHRADISCQCSCLSVAPSVPHAHNITVVTLFPRHLWLHCNIVPVK